MMRFRVLKSWTRRALLTVLLYFLFIDSVKNATGPLLIEIEKTLGSIIGISLTQKWIRGNRSIIVIDNVKPASIADR